MEKKIGVLSLSGGMDSTSLLLNMLKEGMDVYCLSFDYGQKHKIELKRVQKNLKYLRKKGFSIKHDIVDLSILGKLYNSALTSSDITVPIGFYNSENMKATVVPNRNAIFSSIVYGYALSLSEQHQKDAVIALGIHAGDHFIYLDCRPEFRDAIGHAFKIGNLGSERVEYYTPYLYGDKKTILVEAKENCKALKLKFDTIFKNTNTCYNPNEKGESCGKCGSCQERLLAFYDIKQQDPVSYSSDYNALIENVLKSEKDFNELNK